MEYVSLIISVISFIMLFICLYVIFYLKKESSSKNDISAEISREIRESGRDISSMMSINVKTLGDTFMESSAKSLEQQNQRLSDMALHDSQRDAQLQQMIGESFAHFDERFSAFTAENRRAVSEMRVDFESKVKAMQDDNSKQLDKIRETVDEKLQKTLEDRISKSFAVVSERLEQVYKGLGEMQTLASGVGDLKKVLSNVKTRGIVGEIQLGAILQQILSPEQYDVNIVTRKNSRDPVEYAVKLPGNDGDPVYLPIDSKFPADTYMQLKDAYDSADSTSIEAARKHLEAVIKSFAKDIRDKYIDPPYTTDFAVMFLPFEGLYAEVINCGLVDVLQNEYKISIAGPTTMAALLNSLQMGFKTLAIQKRTGEVWKVLGAVKTEFDRFGDVLEAAQKRIEQTSSELDKLVGVRTRVIRSKLRSVSELPADEALNILDEANE